MQKTTLISLGLVLMLLFIPVSVSVAGEYIPMFFPDRETAFKVPDRGSWFSPSGLDTPEYLRVPTSWLSPTASNYTAFLKAPEWKSWSPVATIDFTTSLTVPEWKSWKPVFAPDWDNIFTLPRRR